MRGKRGGWRREGGEGGRRGGGRRGGGGGRGSGETSTFLMLTGPEIDVYSWRANHI